MPPMGYPMQQQQQQMPQPMDPGSFKQLEERLKRGFASDKLAEVKMAIGGGACFTSAQAKVLLKAIHGDSEQKEAALALYPRIMDRANFGDALSAMTFGSSRQEVMKQLNH